jgi:hypothetical protein
MGDVIRILEASGDTHQRVCAPVSSNTEPANQYEPQEAHNCQNDGQGELERSQF